MNYEGTNIPDFRPGNGNQLANKEKAIQWFMKNNPEAERHGNLVALDSVIYTISAYTDPAAAMVKKTDKESRDADRIEGAVRGAVYLAFRRMKDGKRVVLYTINDYDALKAQAGINANQSSVAWENVQKVADETHVYPVMHT